ncbi:TetR/AcrR family transcriptional regulator [Streptomyces sp. PTM05]|uniref:TetR/AcrR family transcriptional regulator n=1 Tax=Streptantibioticus parmotrematis TaxID=2873249 RepID=A0ABS7QWD7_9ACTN|nr:TetR/AcrR family transcriptional regulator [Streptantibioticus parmotrematis]MBY8886984.1 TetR/AcrR family transcriptional regulator [Streptantibioticus parmotrematis]
MARWEPDAADRLQVAALELFAEKGFERVTIEEISRRAGLTKRSFFNHFTDKREALFGSGPELQKQIVMREITAQDEGLPPLKVVVRALQAVADEMFQDRRDAVARRARIILATPELQERELQKRETLTGIVASALQQRGLDAATALITARAGMLVQQTAMQEWIHDSGTTPLRQVLADTLQSLHAVVANTKRPMTQWRRHAAGPSGS